MEADEANSTGCKIEGLMLFYKLKLEKVCKDIQMGNGISGLEKILEAIKADSYMIQSRYLRVLCDRAIWKCKYEMEEIRELLLKIINVLGNSNEEDYSVKKYSKEIKLINTLKIADYYQKFEELDNSELYEEDSKGWRCDIY